MNADNIKKSFQRNPTFLFYIDEYFENNKVMLENNGISKDTLVSWQHEAIYKSDKMTRDFLKSKGKPTYRIIGLLYLSLDGYYLPNIETLTRSVKTLELVAKVENHEYWDILFKYDDADIKGASAHNLTINELVVDYEIFKELWPPQDRGLITAEPGRFGGLLPYLYNHGYKDLYQKALSIFIGKLKESFVDMIPIALSLFNFCAIHDKTNYKLVKTLFEDAKKNQKFKDFDWNGKLQDICHIIYIKEDNNGKTIDQVICPSHNE